jgi:hypothetical protein
MSENIEISICTDCLYIAANGADNLVLAEVEWPGIDEDWIVAPGHIHTIEMCGFAAWNGTADCPYDEGSFSWSPCDACRRPHNAGERYPASTFPIPGR